MQPCQKLRPPANDGLGALVAAYAEALMAYGECAQRNRDWREWATAK